LIDPVKLTIVLLFVLLPPEIEEALRLEEMAAS